MTRWTIDILFSPTATAPAPEQMLPVLPPFLAEWQRQAAPLVVRMRPHQPPPEEAFMAFEAAARAHNCQAQKEGKIWWLGGTWMQIQSLAPALSSPALSTLGEALTQTLQNIVAPPAWSTTIGARAFRWGERCYIMGIINVTPDSFSGDGLLTGRGTPEDWASLAAERAQAFVSQGADILDIGGESTRPGAEAVDEEEELQRVIPAIRAIRRETDIPISIDTSKARVARAALDAGADMINDVWGLQMDPAMGPLAADRGVPVILMHNRSQPKHAALSHTLGGRYVGVPYEDLMLDILEELQAQVEQAEGWGIPRTQIIVDPGLGFGKTVPQNLYLLSRCHALRALGLPILLGPSRKSFIGYTLNLPPEKRLYGTLATLVAAIIRGGVDILRVHDVEAAVQAVHMAEALIRSETPNPLT